jgi:hypothetical protein
MLCSCFIENARTNNCTNGKWLTIHNLPEEDKKKDFDKTEKD